MKAEFVEDVPATPENMDRLYAKIALQMTQAISLRKPVLLTVWHDDENFQQIGVGIDDRNMAQVTVGMMMNFKLAFVWACKHIEDYVQSQKIMKGNTDAPKE